jgi:hypothetical protein
LFHICCPNLIDAGCWILDPGPKKVSFSSIKFPGSFQKLQIRIGTITVIVLEPMTLKKGRKKK